MMESEWKQMEKTRENKSLRVETAGGRDGGEPGCGEGGREEGREGVRPRWKIYSHPMCTQREKQSECPSLKSNSGLAVAGERESQSNWIESHDAFLKEALRNLTLCLWPPKKEICFRFLRDQQQQQCLTVCVLQLTSAPSESTMFLSEMRCQAKD